MDILVLVLGILLLLVLIIKFKFNTYVSLIITAVVVALGLGMAPAKIATSIQNGIGAQLGWSSASVPCLVDWLLMLVELTALRIPSSMPLVAADCNLPLFWHLSLSVLLCSLKLGLSCWFQLFSPLRLKQAFQF